MADTRTDDEKAKEIESTVSYLADIRQPFEGQVDQILTYVNHSRRKISDKDTSKGNKTGTQVYDGTAMSAINLLTDGMVGYLCARNLRWFRFSIPGKFNFPRSVGMRQWSGRRMDEYPEVRRWLQDCEEVQYSAFARSNFYDIVTEFIRDGAGPGTAHIIAEEEVGAGRVVFTVPHFRECYIAENQYGRVDTNYRVYKMTLRQLADKFGMDRMKAIDTKFEKSYKDNCHSEREIIHAVYPRKDYDQSRENGANKPVASVWVLRAETKSSEKNDGSKLIQENGYDWMPTVTWRWRKNSDEWYGRSPSWDAFIDIMTANQQGRTNLVAAHKMAEPPMVGTSDLRGQVNSGPNGWTWIDPIGGGMTVGDRAPRPLQTGIQLPFAIDSLDRTQKIIRDHYAVDFFLMLTMAAANKVDLTATQVIEMMGEKAAVLGTRVGMLQSEALDPIHDRVFDIEYRAGRMPAPPQVLQDVMGGRIEIDYLGPLAQAQIRLSKSRSIQAGISFATQIAQISPASLDKIDWDKATVEALDSAGFPQNCLRPDEQVTAIRQNRMKQQQAQEQVDSMGPMAKLLRAGTSKPETGSPAQKILMPEESEAGAA